jgi:hypothetical protein
MPIGTISCRPSHDGPTGKGRTFEVEVELVGKIANMVALSPGLLSRECTEADLGRWPPGPEIWLTPWAGLPRFIACPAATTPRSRDPPTARASFLFKHALVQDTAYSMLLRGPRRSLHARIADALEERFPDATRRRPETLAHHFTEAGLFEKAVGY